MNNIVKSVVFAAVVLFAGIAAMQVIYKNQDATSDITAVEPAAGEAATITEGQPADTQAQPVADTMTEDQADAAKEAVDANADAAKEAIDAQADAAKENADAAVDAAKENVDAAKEEVKATEDAAEATKDAAAADAEAAKDAVDVEADKAKEAVEDKTAE
jgi:hypothetical protein